MSDQDPFERILASLHEAMLDDVQWPVTSALIDEACGTQGNTLLPHLRQFVRVQQALASAEALGASVTGLLDTHRIGAIHLDRPGRIVEANDRARAILRHGHGLSDRDGLLYARVPTSSAPAGSGSMTLRRSAGVPRFVVHVKPVVVRQPDFGAQRVAALVLIAEPGQVSRIDPA